MVPVFRITTDISDKTRTSFKKVLDNQEFAFVENLGDAQVNILGSISVGPQSLERWLQYLKPVDPPYVKEYAPVFPHPEFRM